MTQSNNTFKVGQTVWWLNDNLQEVREATVTEVIIPKFGLQRNKSWKIKLDDMQLICYMFEIYSTKKDAYMAGFARLDRMIKITNIKLDNARAHRARLILSENLSLRGLDKS
jgi:hypothetical protein